MNMASEFSEAVRSAAEIAGGHGPADAGLWSVFASTESAQEFCQAWLAILCRTASGVAAGVLLLEDEAGTYIPAAVWPDPQRDVTYLGESASRCLTQREGVIQPATRPDGANAVFIAYPVEVDGRLFGAVVLDAASRPEAELQSMLRSLHWGAGWLEALARRRAALESTRHLEQARLAMDMLAAVGEGEQLPQAAMILANELAQRLGCERVCIGLERKHRVRLLAMSNSAWFDRKSQLVTQIENAMEEALDQRKSACWPAVDGIPHAIAVAHRDIAGNGAVASVVASSRGRSIGVITLERPRGPAFGKAEVELAQAAASLAGPLLESKAEAHRWFAGRAAGGLRRFARNLADPRRPSFRIATGLALLALVLLVVMDGEYRVSAKSVVEGEVQRALVAPFDGFVAEAPVRAGQTVVAGATLARLDDRDLAVERQRLASEREQHERKYRDALAKHERPSARILAAQIAEADARLALVEEKLARTRIRAPFDGIVVSGDLSQMLGSPVEQGKVLFELAPLDAYRVILKVDEHDVRHVAAGQTGLLVLSGLTGESLPFRVKNISVASAEEGGNFFRVEAQLTEPGVRLRPGMEGVGKIVIGERKLAWIWTHRLTDWLRLKFWTWMP